MSISRSVAKLGHVARFIVDHRRGCDLDSDAPIKSQPIAAASAGVEMEFSCPKCGARLRSFISREDAIALGRDDETFRRLFQRIERQSVN